MPRQVVREHPAADDLEWERGTASAFAQAKGLAWYQATSNPGMGALGRRTLQRITDADANSPFPKADDAAESYPVDLREAPTAG